MRPSTTIVLFALVQVVGGTWTTIGPSSLGACSGGESCLKLATPDVNVTTATWWDTKLQVTSGFNTTFTFKIEEASPTCPIKDTQTCVTRGGHGFALVLQNALTGLATIGRGADGLGYDGMDNSIALEFDTWYNKAVGDLYDNHISIQTRGRTNSNSVMHKYSLGQTVEIPELTAEEHTVKLVYTQGFDPDVIHQSRCQATRSCGKVQSLENLASMTLEGLYNTGAGLLYVYLDDMVTPRFISPLKIDSLLDLGGGDSAYFGFTAATGIRQWQVPKISAWTVCNPTCTTLV